ncbi:PQQ-dependent sugar dehydrogenase [Streptomyces sp. CMB-StM0423]|uniref:PQQ-dependent sugar dehydrogenase n=1 Tax=Streptomyces sp. CMB-StM0423 TaxID=2059884 RepID=UPI000C7062D2|nr:PQQ-dependent sugar dehydrogenase [Streptomyces sp. CMB-StM0423]AUH44093.1 glycosyl hydrolase [Streptomyces sp. CMB-StM0423]
MLRRLALLAAGAVSAALLVAPGATAVAPQAAEPPPPDTAFEKITLNDRPGEPLDLAVLPDKRVLHVTRAGKVWINDPDGGTNKLAAELDVYQHDEEGLQNVAIDPDFSHNKWVYLYYSPPLDTPVDDPVTPANEGDAPFEGTQEDWDRYQGHLQLSRYKLKGDTLDLGTEQKILQVPVDRGICCHVGGDIAFDSENNLYLTTGDDTNPFQSDGFTPIDERGNRNPAFDAQRTSGNTNDLRGKVLRIKVRGNGSYAIPQGNLFRPGTEKTRPEIYAMGLRNPYRMEIDPQTDDVYVADYSPDARENSSTRGPAGQGKWLVLDEPANYGWPYCATAKLPYNDYDFATGASGAPFDCAAPVNASPHNTGRTELPPVEQPEVWYSYGVSAEFPGLGTGGIAPMAGPAYEYKRVTEVVNPGVAWPRYYDGTPLFGEWTRDYIKEFRLDGSGAVEAINPVAQGVGKPPVDNPMDMEFGPDGALYVLEYGDGYFSENPDAQLSRIDYIGRTGNHAPKPALTASPVKGLAPLTVGFSAEGTTDPDGDRVRYAWDFDGDGRTDSTDVSPSHTYAEDGTYKAALQITDSKGRAAYKDVDITVGNQAPVVTLVKPADQQEFHFGDAVQFEVTVSDEAAVDCSKVNVHYIVGHDAHGHPQSTTAGCSGTIQTEPVAGHDPSEGNVTGVFVAEYTDPGGLTGSDRAVMKIVG